MPGGDGVGFGPGREGGLAPFTEYLFNIPTLVLSLKSMFLFSIETLTSQTLEDRTLLFVRVRFIAFIQHLRDTSGVLIIQQNGKCLFFTFMTLM